MKEPDDPHKMAADIPIDYMPIALRCFTHYVAPIKNKRRDKKRKKELFQQLRQIIPLSENHPAT